MMNTRFMLAAAAVAVVLTAASANAGVIVEEKFGGNGGGLAGTAADTFSPGITAAGGSATWVANGGFLDNGSVNAYKKAAYLNLGSYINNAKGTAKGLFKLNVTVSEITASLWISIGFGQENAPSTDRDFTNATTNNPAPAQTTNGLGTIVYRVQTGATGGELDMYGGVAGANAVDGPDFNTGSRTLTVTLDLTPAGGTYGKVTWSDSQLGVLGSHTYTAARNFGSILITAPGTGTISNLTLSQAGVAGPAYAPDPVDDETRVNINLSNRTVPGAVSWTSPDSPDEPEIVQVFGYNVYMDTNPTKVANATAASADLLYRRLQSGGQTGTGFAPGANLAYNTTFYWRVDAVVDLASVAGTTLATATTVPGGVWSFTTMAPVDSPTPGNGETNAALSSVISWQTPAAGSLTYDVYFGTDLNAVTQAGRVDYNSLSRFAGEWLRAGDLESDRNDDNKVDFADFSSFGNTWACPEFKGNQTTRSFNPVGLQEKTTYYWRIDAVDASNNVYKGSVWSFSTYDTILIRQQMLAKYDTEGVPYVLNNQKLPGYNPTGDPNDILAGQINSADLGPLENSFNQRNAGAIYPLAFCYVNPNSTYYRNANVLNRILLALDYSCRAQGKNGGFNEKVDTANGQTGYCGVTLPNGGNNTRIDGASTVMGFPFFCIGRSIVMLKDEPAFIAALDTVFIDNDGNGTKDIKRRDAYKAMFDNSRGTMTGIIECMMKGKCKGGHPNQDVGALAAVQACVEAYRALNNGALYSGLTQANLDSHRDRVLFDNASVIQTFLDPTRRNWWTDKFMILEVGHGASGYDTGYANTIPSLLGSYARRTNDPVVGGFITSFMNGYQYFYVLDDAWDDAGYWEWRTSRRQGDSRMPLFAAGVSQPYHPGHALIYDKTLAKCAKNPSLFLNVPWSGGLESSAFGELLNNWSNPVDSDYVLPCNRPETFTYTDLEANLEVIKTGASPTTVTWKAFNYDGATKTYTYEAP